MATNEVTHATSRVRRAFTPLLRIRDSLGVTNTYSLTPATESVLVRNETTPGAEYRITREGDTLLCSCPGFEDRGWCKHRDAVIAFLRLITEIPEVPSGSFRNLQKTPLT